MRFLVIAAGEGTRWGDHLGVPKHLVTVEGERLIDRTARLFSTYGEVVVIGPDDRYRTPHSGLYVPTITPSNGGVDKFLSSRCLWDPDGRTVVLYGDVWFSDDAAHTIGSFPDREWQLFARIDGSKLTGCTWGECFAHSFWPEHHEEHLTRMLLVRDMEATGEISRSGGWEHYRAMCGARNAARLGQHGAFGRLTVIDDWTDDFDFPIDLDRWISRRAQA